MKILAIYDSITGLFPKRILVTLVHALNGNVIGSYKMNSEDLPEIFNKPTILKISEHSWRVTKAIPVRLDSIKPNKKLVLHVVESAASFKGIEGHCIVPTLSSSSLVAGAFFPDDCDIMAPENWRQLEFFPTSQLQSIQEEMLIVEDILNTVKEDEGLMGYKTVHERSHVEGFSLNIPYDQFLRSINSIEKRSIQLIHTESVSGGFSICSENYRYYGVMKDDHILNLCLQDFDCVDDEFFAIVNEYDLILADWCNGNIIF